MLHDYETNRNEWSDTVRKHQETRAKVDMLFFERAVKQRYTRKPKKISCGKHHIGHDWDYENGVYYCKRCRTIVEKKRDNAA